MPEYPRKFIHKGEEHLSFKGYFVTAKTYYFHKNKKVPEPDEAIFMDYGTECESIFEARDRLRERWHKSFPLLHNMEEHYEYILKNFMELEDAVKLREKMKGKTDEEKIHMMPVAFAWVLSIHLLQQKRQGRGSVKPKVVEPEPESNFMDYEDDGDTLGIL